ncbi:MAG: serine hydrolase, partial [Planctomycetaceae bacterium]|nr:serine hydrolase [Planctomycetaceae bacterium]
MKQPLLALLCLIPSTLLAQAPALPRATPESQGIDSAQLQAFVAALDEHVDTAHSVMLLRHGQVVAEGWWGPESAEKPHVLYSLSKSFTSTAVGLAIAEGKLDLYDP